MIEPEDTKILAKLVNLASPRLGTRVEAASDDFFADKARMIQDSEPVFIADKFDQNGKWMDGWETRRRRGLGHDWCLVRLGTPGVLSFIDIDTRHFTGNYPPAASVEGCTDATPDSSTKWRMLVPTSGLGPNQRHLFPVDDGKPVKWLRLSIFPDGGIARLRAYGKPFFDPNTVSADEEIELSALKYGGRIIGYSDAHYGDPWRILTEGRGRNMGDGWETRRRREPVHDWMVIALGVAGTIDRLEVDTAHFKGNYPEKISLQACRMEGGIDDYTICRAMFWKDLMLPQLARADAIHMFGSDVLTPLGPVTHVRLNIHPDGGISRFRAFGRRAS